MMVNDLDILIVIVSAIMSGRGFEYRVIVDLRGWRLVDEVLMEVYLRGCEVLFESRVVLIDQKVFIVGVSKHLS